MKLPFGISISRSKPAVTIPPAYDPMGLGQRSLTPKNVSTFISPVQLQRMRIDVAEWRQAIFEAENAWNPNRVRMQRMYLDTKLNGHVYAAWQRRKELNLLRKFKITNKAGVEYTEWTEYFKNAPWFRSFRDYTLDARAFGYTNIELGDCIDNNFPKLKYTRRWNIRPDGVPTEVGNTGPIVTSLIYSLDGIHLFEEPWKDWNIWVGTPSDTGVSDTGYGLYYIVALYEIMMRNLLAGNADFVQNYAAPFRIGKTSKTEESERAELAASLEALGSNGWALLDPMDEIEFLEASLAGTGWQSYDNLEERCKKTISKIILGHADALDSTAGKLGSGQGGKTHDGFSVSPVDQALDDKQADDAEFMEPVIHNDLFPRMRKIGVAVPDDAVFVYDNDMEVQEATNRENKSNKDVADIVKTLHDSGFAVDAAYIKKRTGIPVTEAIPTEEEIMIKDDETEGEDDAPDGDNAPAVDPKGEAADIKKINNRLKILYK